MAKSVAPAGTNIFRVLGKFGGVLALSRALGHKNPSTVSAWCQRGIIPARQHQAVWDAAKRHGVDLTSSDIAGIADDEPNKTPSVALLPVVMLKDGFITMTIEQFAHLLKRIK